MINAIIMASGYSRRMGENKLLMPFRDKLLVEYIIDKVLECSFYNSVIVSKDEGVLNIAVQKGIKVIKNEDAYKGQSESIKLGINNTLRADGYMFFTADQPLINIKTVRLLIDTFNKHSSSRIVIPRFREKRGNPVIFPEKFIGEMMMLEGDNGGRSVIDRHIKDVVFVDITNANELKDIDTYEDYEKLLNINDLYENM